MTQSKPPVIVVCLAVFVGVAAYVTFPYHNYTFGRFFSFDRFSFGITCTLGGQSVATAELNSFKTSLIAYRAMAGTYPTTEQGLIALAKQPETDPKPLMWRQIYESESIKKDPWRHDYQYACPGSKNPNGYDLYSMGEDGKPGTPDDVWAN